MVSNTESLKEATKVVDGYFESIEMGEITSFGRAMQDMSEKAVQEFGGSYYTGINSSWMRLD